jgi:hypothetical protein
VEGGAAMNEQRLVVLVPSERDIADRRVAPASVYWPNFVEAVKDALARARIDCRVLVVTRRLEDDA